MMVTPVILASKLRIGGVWYHSGARVELPDEDARSYVALRMARLTLPSDRPKKGDVVVKKEAMLPESLPDSTDGSKLPPKVNPLPADKPDDGPKPEVGEPAKEEPKPAAQAAHLHKGFQNKYNKRR